MSLAWGVGFSRPGCRGARLLGSERKQRIAFTRSAGTRDFTEEHDDKESDQHDADENREQEDVHGFVGAGWFAGNVGEGIGGTVDNGTSAPFFVPQRQSWQRPQLVGGVIFGSEDLRFINTATLPQRGPPCSPAIAQDLPFLVLRS